MTVEEIIETCGGEHKIIARLELSGTDVVRRWKTHGIPLVHWPVLMDMAFAEGVELTGQHLWSAVEPLIAKTA
jgi:hypothetical protein